MTHNEAGLYTCTVTNTVSPSGEVARERVGSAAVRVEVRHPPGEAFIEPEEPVGIEGKSVELRWTQPVNLRFDLTHLHPGVEQLPPGSPCLSTSGGRRVNLVRS